MRTESDAELIEAYAERDDQGAFAEIVSRHGGMVYRVCFRKLVNRHDAEDASQAVFMTLVKKSKQVKWESSLAKWIYTVARQTALFMARTRFRYVQKESAALKIMASESYPQVTEHDQETALEFLDNELAALSAAQQEAVILRYMHGLSEKDAATMAGCAPNTLSCRASEGIARLRQRLVKRGCALGIPALIAVLEAEAHAAIPETLIPSLLAVPKLAAAGAAAGSGAGSIITVMEGTMKVMFMTKMKMVVGGLMAVALIGTVSVTAVFKLHGKSSGAKTVTSAEQKADLSKKQSASSNLKKKSAERNFPKEAEEALTEMKRHKNENTVFCFGDVMREWAAANHDAAARWAEQLQEEEIRNMALVKVAVGWAHDDPDAAAKWAEQFPASIRDLMLHSIAREWARTDPEAAARWVVDKLPTGMQALILRSVVAEWYEKDPQVAAQWAEQLPEGNVRNAALSAVASGKAPEDPEAVAQWADEAVAQWAEQLPKSTRYETVNKAADKMGKKNPEAMLRWVELLPKDLHDYALYSGVVGWAMEDFEAARKWVEQLPEGQRPFGIQEGMVCSWASKMLSGSDIDFEALKGWIEQLPDGKVRNLVINRMAPELVFYKGNDAAMQWIETLPEGDARNAALLSTIGTIAGKNPEKATELLNAMPEGEGEAQARNQAMVSIAIGWTKKDLKKAVEVVMALPAGEEGPLYRQNALNNIVITLTIRDPQAAVKLVETLPDVKMIGDDLSAKNIRDGGYFMVGQTWGKGDLEAATRWVEQMPEGDARCFAAQGVFDSLFFGGVTSSTNAKNWLKNTSLSESEKNKILRWLQSTSRPQ